jgi:hypothetical protein
MKLIALFNVPLVFWLSTSFLAAESDPKAEVVNAAKKLSNQPNYSWTVTAGGPENEAARPAPAVLGQTEKDGLTTVTMTLGQNTMKAVLKGEKAAATLPGGGWQSLVEVEKSQGAGSLSSRIVKSFKVPPAQALQLLTDAKNLRKEGELYLADLSDDVVNSILTLRPGSETNGFATSGVSGTAKFWVKDGSLAKYEYRIKGSLKLHGIDRLVDRSTLVEIRDVGTTKIELPAEAKEKLL